MTAVETNSDPVAFFGLLSNDIVAVEYHLDRLTATGELCHVQRIIRGVQNNSPMRKQISQQLLRGPTPPAAYWSSEAAGGLYSDDR